MLDAITSIQYLDGLEVHDYSDRPSWENSKVDLCRRFLSSFTPNGKCHMSFSTNTLISRAPMTIQGTGMTAQLDMLYETRGDLDFTLTFIYRQHSNRSAPRFFNAGTRSYSGAGLRTTRAHLKEVCLMYTIISENNGIYKFRYIDCTWLLS